MAPNAKNKVTGHEMSPSEYERRLRQNAEEGKAADNAETAALVAASGTALASPMVSQVSEDMIAELMAGVAAGELEASPVFVSVDPGMVIRGTLVGQSKTEVEDRSTKEMKAVTTWIFADDKGNRIQVLSTFQLDNELAEINQETGEVVAKIGRYVTIARLSDERTNKGNTVARWRVFFKKGA